MHNIFCNGVSCFITSLGVISSIDIDGIYQVSDSLPVYGFIYEEYTKTNPACIHFNDDRDIDILGKTQTSIEFTKIFSHPHTHDELILKYIISVHEQTIDIKIEVLTPTPINYRYGMVIPIGNFPVHLHNDIKFHNSLVNFHRIWDRKWPDQTYVDAPIVSIGKQNYYSVFCPIDYNSQFFFHEQHDNNCVRVSTSTHSSTTINIVIHRHDCHAKEAYVQYFPAADHYVNFWKVTHNKLQKVHGLHITYNLSGVFNEISFDPVPIDDIDKSTRILDEELFKYHCPLNKIGLKEIILCTNLRKNDEKISGTLVRNSNMFIDIDANYKPENSIHHEIFHLIQNSTNITPWIGKFQQLHDVPSDMKLDNTVEDMAELFSVMMTDPSMLQSVINEYVDVQHRCEIIERIFESTLNTKMIWKRLQTVHGPRYQDADISIMHPKSRGVFIGDAKNKVSSDNKEQITILYGMQHSGVKLLHEYLQKYADITIIRDLNELRNSHKSPVVFFPDQSWTANDIINLSKYVEGKILWIVRNPRYCDSDKEFETWVDNYSAILKFTRSKMVKYESLIINDKQVISEVCDYLDCPVVDFQSLIDYDKVIYNSNINIHNKLFIKYQGYPIFGTTEYK